MMNRLLIVTTLSLVATLALAGVARADMLLDDFDSQSATAPFTYDDGTTSPDWWWHGGGGMTQMTSGDYGMEGAASYADLRLGSADPASYNASARVLIANDLAALRFTMTNLRASNFSGINRSFSIRWQNATQLNQSAGRRASTISYMLPSVSAGESVVVTIPFSSFVAGGDVFGTSDNRHFAALEIKDAGYSDIVWDDFAFTAVPEPATMGLLGLGLVGVMLRRKKK